MHMRVRWSCMHMRVRCPARMRVSVMHAMFPLCSIIPATATQAQGYYPHCACRSRGHDHYYYNSLCKKESVFLVR